MSIIFNMSRVTPEAYERLIAGEPMKEPASDEVSLEKTWSVLFRFLQGGDPAIPRRLARAVAGGEHLDTLGDYGGPRVLSPKQVALVVHDLDGGDVPEEHREPFDEKKIRSLYKVIDQTGAYSAPASVESVVEAFRTLDAFYRRAAAAGDAVLIELY